MKASAFYACTYDTARDATGMALPDMAWWGARYLNALRARELSSIGFASTRTVKLTIVCCSERHGERVMVFGPAPATAPDFRPVQPSLQQNIDNITVRIQDQGLVAAREKQERLRLQHLQGWHDLRKLQNKDKRRTSAYTGGTVNLKRLQSLHEQGYETLRRTGEQDSNDPAGKSGGKGIPSQPKPKRRKTTHNATAE